MEMSSRSCGSCSLCCKVLRIDALEKPPHEWCRHVVDGGGCGIYAKRPKVCRGFQCRWLFDEALGPEWKPDVSGFVLSYSKTGLGLWANVDLEAPGSWRRSPYYAQLKQWFAVACHGGGCVAICVGERVLVIFPEEDLEIQGCDSEADIKVGYRCNPLGVRPLVMVRRADGSVSEFLGALCATA